MVEIILVLAKCVPWLGSVFWTQLSPGVTSAATKTSRLLLLAILPRLASFHRANMASAAEVNEVETIQQEEDGPKRPYRSYKYNESNQMFYEMLTLDKGRNFSNLDIRSGTE